MIIIPTSCPNISGIISRVYSLQDVEEVENGNIEKKGTSSDKDDCYSR